MYVGFVFGGLAATNTLILLGKEVRSKCFSAPDLVLKSARRTHL